MDERYPSHQLAKFQIRLDGELRDLLRAAAERNIRSLNSEIVSRLRASVSGAELIPAREAATRAAKARQDQATALRSTAANAIRAAAATGHTRACISVAEMAPAAIDEVVRQLTQLEYRVAVAGTEMVITFG